MLLSEYAAPAATLKFSIPYFASLTFSRVLDLDYPTISSTSIVQRWCFSNETPTTASGVVILPGELIPPLKDLLPITRDLESAFQNGSRSVTLLLNVGGSASALHLHFSKIRLLITINNNRSAVLGAQNLYRHILSNALLSPEDIERFGRLSIFAPVVGFRITDFPLWKLSCLLGETWLEEDVLNALLELLYLQEAIKTRDDPSFLILPTS
ncbi:hypothetical protein FB45DRAFT_751843, partial [Roridomyces roridus]